MLRIQDPLLEDLLHFCSLQNEFVFLDTSLPDYENSQSLLFVNPESRLVCKEGDDLELYLQLLQTQLTSGYYLAGWVGYEFGSMIEGRYARDTNSISEPPRVLADFGVFLKPFKFNHHTGNNNFPVQPQGLVAEVDLGFSLSNLKPNMGEDEFVEALDKIKEFIAAGDTYQVNYTMKLLFDFHGSVENFYRSLRRNQSVGYGAYIKNGEESILSFSPELFFRKTSEKISVRPMKGTAVRGCNLDQETQHKKTLHQDPKNRAENVMIVDLLRNDLSRLLYGSEEASVTTQSLFDVESYESLLQMTSTVCGTASGDTIKKLSLSRLFHSLFPCGSITGAPKIQTMQIIEDLEKEPRGVYTGAIGYLAPDGDAVFNVPIRTIHLHGSKGEMGIGAGITHGSVPVDEWDESLLKGRFLTHSQIEFQLFETILWRKESGFFLLEEHLLRLQRGADFFKFFMDPSEARKYLFKETSVFSDNCMRVRLVLEKDGRLAASATPCDPPPFLTLPLASEVDARPVGGSVRFAKGCAEDGEQYLYYKTSRRTAYDQEFRVVAQRGDIDALFCNEKAEMTEGCISNIVILKNGIYSTPPVSCGLLPGVMRERLLSASGGVPVPVEAILTRDDVQGADAVFVCNSVRGVVRVKLAG
ncbi:MAG: para-aminobenzoate synthetase/4-amino-4-deoxychorismate lyase [Desulforhopalus sp.]|jgi:para-aminobenzoate synthetase/4-amino-4-deoxychorismate lyase